MILVQNLSENKIDYITNLKNVIKLHYKFRDNIK